MTEKRTDRETDRSKDDAAARKPAQERNAPQPDPENEVAAARRSGQVGADHPSYKNEGPEVHRDADKKPNPAGPEYEEGGQYPGARRDPKAPRH